MSTSRDRDPDLTMGDSAAATQRQAGSAFGAFPSVTLFPPQQQQQTRSAFAPPTSTPSGPASTRIDWKTGLPLPSGSTPSTTTSTTTGNPDVRSGGWSAFPPRDLFPADRQVRSPFAPPITNLNTDFDWKAGRQFNPLPTPPADVRPAPNEVQGPEPELLHAGISCDFCGKGGIRGIRYKCIQCPSECRYYRRRTYYCLHREI